MSAAPPPDPAPSHQAAPPALEAWAANPFTGPLTQLAEVPGRPHDPAVYMVAGSLAPARPGDPPRSVSGAGWTLDAARRACLGEAFERAAAAPGSEDARVVASFGAWPLDEPAVDPGAFVGFHPAQYATPGFPFRPPTADLEVTWAATRDLDGHPAWCPAEHVFLDLPPGEDHVLAPGISTGLVAGPRRAPLVLWGLHEVLERDAVVGAWWDAYPLTRLDPVACFHALGAARAARLQRPNLEYRFFHVTSPYTRGAAMVLLEGADLEGPVVSVGAACRPTLVEALEKAALEAVQGRVYARQLSRIRPALPVAPLTEFADHARFYTRVPEALADTVLARAPLGDLPPAAPPEDLASLRPGLGHPVLWRDLTPRRLASFAPDLAVLRVLVPGLQPLWGDDRFPPLGGPLWRGRDPAAFAALPPHPFP